MRLVRLHQGGRVRSLAIGILSVGFMVSAGPMPFAGAEEPAGKAYSIRLSPPYKVGDKYERSASGSQRATNVVTVAGKEPVTQESTLAVEFEGTFEVLQVNSKSRPTKLAFTVKKCVTTNGPAPAELLPPGAVVIADANPQPGAAEGAKTKTRFLLKDEEIGPEESKALELVLGASAPDAVTDDETFGTNKPQQVGATWPINREKCLKGAEQLGIAMKPEDFEGQSTLVGVKQLDGKDYLEVKATMTTENIMPPLPPGMKVDKMKMVGKFSGLFPVGATSPLGAETTDMEMEMSASGNAPNVGAVRMHITGQRHQESKTRPAATPK